MSIDIRYPNITGVTEREQLAQIKSYLHQLVEQLNYAFATANVGSVGDSSSTYGDLNNLVMSESQRINSRINQIKPVIPEVGVDYFTAEDKAQIVSEVLTALAALTEEPTGED